MPLPDRKKHTAEEYFAYTPEDHAERYELIDGEYVALAAPSQQHQEIVGGVYAELRSYIRSNFGRCKPFISPFDVWIDEYNVVQPDVLIVCDSDKLDGKRCNGAPDFVLEVTSNYPSRDYQDKLIIYRNAGVREYWIVDPKNEKTLVYFFDRSDFPDIYTFDTPIPVGIYGGELSISIAELLK